MSAPGGPKILIHSSLVLSLIRAAMVMAELESPACKQSKEQFWIIKDLASTARESHKEFHRASAQSCRQQL